jgi:hypothetical protein
MADDAQKIRGIDWQEAFPVTRLFQAFRVAVHPSKLFLALAALLLIYAGGNALDKVWPDKYLAPQDTLEVEPRERLTKDQKQGIFFTFFSFEVQRVNDIVNSVVPGAGPAKLGPIDATLAFLVEGPGWLWGHHPLFALLFTAWFLVVWSVFGGAIARIAAVHVARDEKISVRQALRFSTNKLLSFLFAPLIPLLILLVIACVVAAASWVLLHIPGLGPIVLGLIFALALLAAFVMALVLLGMAGGFNLMYPTIAVEGSDSFDAISRSFSYAFARPWRMLFYTAVAVVYGALTYLFSRWFLYLVLALAHWSVGWWLGGQPGQYWHGTPDPKTHGTVAMWPEPEFNDLPHTIQYADLAWSEKIAATGIAFWVYLVIGLLGAYAISFYFTANTIIYYLMRREVDATELGDVYVEDTDDDLADAVSAAAAAGAGGTGGTAEKPDVPPPAASAPAPTAGATSAPGGGVTGTAGSADLGNPGPGGAKAYDTPRADAPATPPPPGE